MGTTKYSEQSHVPNHDSKEKEFKLKENSGLKAHESFSESSILSRSSVVPVLGVSSFGQAVGCGESALQIASTVTASSGGRQDETRKWKGCRADARFPLSTRVRVPVTEKSENEFGMPVVVLVWVGVY